MTPAKLLRRIIVLFSSTAVVTGCATVEKSTMAPDVAYHGEFREFESASIAPQGWVKEILKRQVEGLGKHHAVSGYPYDTCLWAGRIPDDPKPGPHSKAWWPYEQAGYLVDGLVRLGIVTKDRTIAAEGSQSVRYILAHAQKDGSLGPDHIGLTNWPHAVVFRAMMAEYAQRPNEKIPQALRRHFLARPETFGVGRDVANVEAMLWTYAHTGDAKLLEIAQRTYDNFNAKKPPSGLTNMRGNQTIVEHGVTFNETAKIPMLLYIYTGDESLLRAAVNAYENIDRDHMTASGMHTAEEKLNGRSPWNYTELCDVTDYTWSVGYLLMATGDATWADRIEKAIFNAGLGAITKDFRAHQYFTAANQVIATNGICKKYHKNRLAYRPQHDVECCSGNMHRMMPNFALRQWLTTPDGAIVAAMYSPSVLKTKVEGVDVTIEQRTQYPFSDTIEFLIKTKRPVTFPLALRIPGWTKDATIHINKESPATAGTPGTFTVLRREFSNGDRITLRLPMSVKVREWDDNTASIERGPLVYSLKIDEETQPVQDDQTTKKLSHLLNRVSRRYHSSAHASLMHAM